MPIASAGVLVNRAALVAARPRRYWSTANSMSEQQEPRVEVTLFDNEDNPATLDDVYLAMEIARTIQEAMRQHELECDEGE